MAVTRIGIVGCGYWGPKLARNFAAARGGALTCVADVIQQRANEVAETYRVPRATDDVGVIMEDPAIDLVVIATPAWTHHDLVKSALERGKHVLVMKPLAPSVEEAEELCALAERKGLLLAVDHTFIFTGAVRKIKELVDAGELGDLYYFDSVRINLGVFQYDVNVLWDLAPHDVSIMDYLMDGLPDEISAVAMCHGESPTENIAYLTARYGETFLGHVHVNWLAPAKIRRTIVGGSRKMLVYDDMEPTYLADNTIMFVSSRCNQINDKRGIHQLGLSQLAWFVRRFWCQIGIARLGYLTSGHRHTPPARAQSLRTTSAGCR